jgi:hypothetical protein
LLSCVSMVTVNYYLQTRPKVIAQKAEDELLERRFAEQIPIGIIEGSVHSGPSFEQSLLNKLAANSQVQFLGITKQLTDGFL